MIDLYILNALIIVTLIGLFIATPFISDWIVKKWYKKKQTLKNNI